MGVSILANMSWIRSRGMEFLNGLMVEVIQENGMMGNKTEEGSSNLQTVKSDRANG